MKRSITEPEASSFTFKGGELRDLFWCDIFSRNTFHFPLKNGWEDHPDLYFFSNPKVWEANFITLRSLSEP